MSEETKTEEPEVVEEVSHEPEAPAERTFTQSEVNALLAKETAKAKRKAKRDLEARMAEQTKQPEPTASTEQDPREAEIAELRESVQALAKANAERESKAEFAAAVAGLELSDSKRRMLKLAFDGDRELFDAEVGELRKADSPPQKDGPKFTGTGVAPNPHADPAKKPPSQWTKEDVATMRANGTFISNLNAFRNSLPGGSGGLFPAKKPKAG